MNYKIGFLVFIISQLLICNGIAKQEGDNRIKKVAVTIDDLPIAGPARSLSFDERKIIFENLLNELKKQNIPLIGFVNGNQLLTDSIVDVAKTNLLKEWMRSGFEIGNHTFSHKSANKVPPAEYEKDIVDNDKILKSIVAGEGKRLKYFRHPFLNTGLNLETKHEIENFLRTNGYEIAPVTIDNSEWIFAAAYEKAFQKDSTQLMQKIAKEYLSYMNLKFEWYEKKTKELFGREISHVLLIHANRLNSDYFGKLCAMIGGRNYTFVPLDEALKDDAYKSEDTFIKNAGISWIDRWALTMGKTKEFFSGEPRTPKYIMDIAGVDSE